jgi:hypothetical protein
MTKRLSAAIVLSLTLALGAMAPASAMTPDYASQYYLNSVCPQIPAWNSVINALSQGNHLVRAGQVKGKRLRRVRAALLRLQRTDFTAASHLTNTPSEWPTPEAASATSKVASALLRERLIIIELRTRSRQSFARYWNRMFIPQDNRVDSYWRLALASLSIPPNGSLGC